MNYFTTIALQIWSNRIIVHVFFFFNDTATTEIYTLSLHDALPIWVFRFTDGRSGLPTGVPVTDGRRSEEHTSELQSQSNLVCRLLLEKKKNYSGPLRKRRSLRPCYSARL